ncbi:MAG: protease modulator HflC [Myxococcota bacterium]|nr:protease modulator HflC [Myxococcota bacterium]
MKLLLGLLVSTACAAGVLWAGHFGYGPVVIVNQWEYKIPLLLGTPWRKPISEPGITFRWPLIETMVTIDKRLKYLDARPAEVPIESEVMIVDYFAIWRISDPLQFRRSFPGLERDASTVIQRRLQSEVGAKISKMALEQLLGRSQVLTALSDEVRQSMSAKGVEILDVRINRTELPERAEQSAYEQMREQRHAKSRELRARGEREAREIRAKAGREAQTLLAQARSKAEIVRGEGDGKAAAIYAQSYQKAPEFYAFLRSLEAYRKTLGTHSTLVAPPDHTFFRYLDPDRLLSSPPAERVGSSEDNPLSQ